ncbi:MAG: hemerythrin domain-containing protein [Sandaracinaceae bacterium]|nr:hemerythrin domain-containing protein [Sandaracinaceae bacterium]
MLRTHATIYELLRQDHEHLTVACARLHPIVDSTDFGRVASAFLRELRDHERVEEEILARPLILRVPDAAIVGSLHRQHDELADKMIALLQAEDAERRATALNELAALAASHFRFEHERVFPASSLVFSSNAQQAMAEAFAHERLAVR